MDDQRWRQIEGVYLAALDAPDRAALLADTCTGDPELRRAVELLLSQEPSTVSLLGRLALDSVSAALSSTKRVPLEPDSTLGRYRIVELLGAGGSSDVYQAYDTQLDRFVALKLFDGTRLTEEFRRRFARESRAAASLNHPNIATVYEVGEAANAWFIAMEYVDGATLREAFRDATCSLRQRLSYLAQAAGGVARAHGTGLAHCDLKPDNIMVTREGLVKVLDFGLARVAGTLDAGGPHFEGTVGYMSPEQAAGQPIDTGSDVFSFGCILFEAVTGTLPFPPGEQWLNTLMHAATPPLRPAPNGVPEGLEALIDDCLVKDPARRPSSLEDVSRRLHAILERKPRLNEWVVAAMVVVTVALSAVIYRAWPVQPPPGSVAVIPFMSAAATPEARRLAESISEAIMNALMQLPDLKVIARSSSFRYASDALDVPAVARTLGVQTLVTGRIVDTNGRVGIRAELVSGRDGTAMWGAEYTPNREQLIDVEAQIAREIARRVQSELTPTDQRRLDKAVHPNAEAYSLLLRGRFEMSLYTAESTQKAVSYFEQALGLDPAYALANAELANAYRRLATLGALKPAEALQRGEQAARKAIALDDELPEAHAALAGIKRDNWQWADAEREYRRAIALSASFGAARQALAIGLTLTGNGDAAVAEIARARELDPVGLPGAVDSTAVFYNLRQYDRALAILKEAFAFDSVAPALLRWSGIVLGGKRDFTGAVAAFQNAIARGDTQASTRCYYAHALARAGRRDQALRELHALQRESTPIAPTSLAIAYVGLGDRERAIAALQAGFAARDPLLQYIVVESYLDDVMDDARVKQIVAGMGLPQPRARAPV